MQGKTFPHWVLRAAPLLSSLGGQASRIVWRQAPMSIKNNHLLKKKAIFFQRDFRAFARCAGSIIDGEFKAK
jgi:hypothetical protein